jgi:hypothetical protein
VLSKPQPLISTQQTRDGLDMPLDRDGDELNEGLLTHSRKPSTHNFARSKPWLQQWLNNKRRLTILFLVFLGLLFLSVIWSLSSSPHKPPPQEAFFPPPAANHTTLPQQPAVQPPVTDANAYLIGEPTPKFRGESLSYYSCIYNADLIS